MEWAHVGGCIAQRRIGTKSDSADVNHVQCSKVVCSLHAHATPDLPTESAKKCARRRNREKRDPGLMYLPPSRTPHTRSLALAHREKDKQINEFIHISHRCKNDIYVLCSLCPSLCLFLLLLCAFFVVFCECAAEFRFSISFIRFNFANTTSTSRSKVHEATTRDAQIPRAMMKRPKRRRR